jgi:hypothetical protein
MSALTTFGYIDPMAGSMAMQGIIAGVFSIVVVFRRFIGRLFVGVFAKRQHSSHD